MNTNSTTANCQRNCWLIALAIGVILAMYLLLSAGWGFFWSLLIGVAIIVGGGILLTRYFCADSTMQDSAAAAPMAAPAPKPAPEPAAEPVAKSAPEVVQEPAVEPIDTPAAPVAAKTTEATDGQAEGQAEGRPEGLAAAREGGADNLKMIKGVGPKLEQLLNSMGYFHFDQIAGWSVQDIAWVDENLAGFKGRVSRDNWVDQAGKLAAGEETDFAKRAKKDGIYD